MRNLFILLCIALAVNCNAQLMVNGYKHASPPPSTPTVFWQMGFQNEFQTTGPAGWKYIYGTPTNISTAGNVTFSGIQTSTGGSPTIGFTNGSGFVSYYSGFSPGGTGVFSDEITQYGWEFNDGATFTLSGLTNGQHYWLYVLSNAASYEPATVSFTVGGNTSNQKANGNNYGSSSTSPWYTDPAFCVVEFTASSTSATVTCNKISGTKAIISAAVLAK